VMRTTELLTYAPAFALLAVAAGAVFTPLGGIALGLLSTSKLARWLAAAGAVALGLVFAAGRRRAHRRRGSCRASTAGTPNP